MITAANENYGATTTKAQIDNRMGIIGDELGSKMLPIVELEFGNKVCFDFRQYPDAPELVWDHERSRSNELSHVEVIAKSFTEFLALLKPLKPYLPGEYPAKRLRISCRYPPRLPAQRCARCTTRKAYSAASSLIW